MAINDRILYMQGFDHIPGTSAAAYLQQYGYTTSGTVARAAARVTGNGYALSLTNALVTKPLLSTQNEIVLQGGFYPTNLSSRVVFALYRSGSANCDFLVNASNQLLFRRGASTIATLSSSISLNTWYYLQARLNVIDAGDYTIYLNGALAASGYADLTNTATPGVDTIAYGTPSYSNYDDVIILNMSGSPTFLGDCKIVTNRPNEDGYYNQFLPSSGSVNYLNVNDGNPDGDNTYVYESGVGKKQLFGFGGLGPTSAIYGVRLFGYTRKQDAGSMIIKAKARMNDTDIDLTTPTGTSIPLSDSYLGWDVYMQNQPDTSGTWSLSNLNAAQFGIEII